MKTLLVTGGPVTQSMWSGLAEKYDLVFMYPQAKGLATDMGIKSRSLVEFLTPEHHEYADNAAVVMGARVVQSLPKLQEQIHSIIPVPNQYLDGNLPEWWAGFIHANLRERITQVMAMRALFEKEKPVGLVTHEDVTPECRTMVMFCKARGVPTIHVPHAACHITDKRDIHRETKCDWIAASGTYERDWFAGNGASQIRVVGKPDLDWAYDPLLPSKEEARRILGLDGFVVTYASTWGQTTSLRGGFGEELSNGVTAVLNLCKSRNAKLAIRVHRSEPPQAEGEYERVMREAGVTGFITREHNHLLVRAGDVLVAQGPSNTCILAAIVGTPSCYIQTEGAEYAHAMPPRCAPEGLDKAVNDALAVTDWTEFVDVYNAAHPLGNATERAVEMVAEICQ